MGKKYLATTERRRLLRQYGLTPADYEEMLSEQGGKCAICGERPAAGQRLAVDHEHKQGKQGIRGLLCTRCNLGIGMFQERIQLLYRAVEYLEEWGIRE